MDHLVTIRISFKTFDKIPWKSVENSIFFPEKLGTGKISLQIRYDSYMGIFRPFGTISEIFDKSSAECSVEDSVIPCFSESVNTWIHAIYSTTHVTRRRCSVGLCGSAKNCRNLLQTWKVSFCLF